MDNAYTKDSVNKAIREAARIDFQEGHITLLAYVIAMGIDLNTTHLDRDQRVKVIGVREEQLVDRVGLAMYECSNLSQDSLFVDLKKQVLDFYNWRLAVAKGLPLATFRLYEGDVYDNVCGLSSFVGNDTLVGLAHLSKNDIKILDMFKTLVGYEWSNIKGEAND